MHSVWDLNCFGGRHFCVLSSLCLWGTTRAQEKQYFRQLIEGYTTWNDGYTWHHQMDTWEPFAEYRLVEALCCQRWLFFQPHPFLTWFCWAGEWQILPDDSSVISLCPSKFWSPEVLITKRLSANWRKEDERSLGSQEGDHGVFHSLFCAVIECLCTNATYYNHMRIIIVVVIIIGHLSCAWYSVTALIHYCSEFP